MSTDLRAGIESHPAVKYLTGPLPNRVPRWTAEDEANLAKRIARLQAAKR